jgi:hypothetical protein
MLLACTAAAILQVVFFVGYFLLTEGCFCATLDSTQAAPHARALVSFLNAVDLVGALGIPGQIGDLPSTLQRLLLNFVAWVMLLFFVLTGGTYITGRLRRS